MQNKIKKLIRQTPAENLKLFLRNYNLDLPEDFRWQNDNKKYYSQLLDSILNSKDKSTLFETIERIHEMVDELGQSALQVEMGRNDNFLSLKSDHARCLWALQHHPEKFQKAEHRASHDHEKESREWIAFVGPKGRKIDDSKERMEEFKRLVLKHFNISKKIKAELSCRAKTDHHGKEIETFQLVAYHDVPHKSVQTYEKKGFVTKFIAFVKEFSISYEPHSGIIEVTSDYQELRAQLAKLFANAFLRIDQEVNEIKKYDLSKLKYYYDFMKDVDPKDNIEDVKVTLLKLKPIDCKNSTTIEAPFGQHCSIYELAHEWFGENNPLLGSFVIKKAKLSIKFKPSDKKPRGELLSFIITEPNGCDLQDRSENHRLIGNKYLERWRILKRI